jgi:hypothetical protein
MGSNRIPDALGALLNMAHDMNDGATTHGAAVGLVHHTSTTLGALLLTTETSQSNYKIADKANSDAGVALRVADSNGKGFIASVRDALKRRLGKIYNADWAVVGFKNNSLAVPESQADRATLLTSIKKYFTDNPTFQINDPNLPLTAASANTYSLALTAATSGVKDKGEDYLVKKGLRDTASKNLRGEMSGMIGEIGDLIDDHDPRWLWFGLNLPGSPTSADPVENLAATPISQGFLATWPHPKNANLFHVEIQVVGVDTAFHRIASTAETNVSATSLPANAAIDLRVLSVSDNGNETAPSNVVRVVTLA